MCPLLQTGALPIAHFVKIGRERGFTLIEVLLALAIFTIIGITTVRTITQITNTKKIAFADLDNYNSLRSTISVIRYDLSQAFHVLRSELGEETQQALDRGLQAPHTLFDGRKNELIFTSLSHRVYYANLRECEQTEISYFLQKRRGSKYPSLVKRESEIIDSDLYQGGSVYTILDNVESLEFQYWDERSGKWQDVWNSDGGEFNDRFPLAVKMKLGINDGSKKGLRVQSEFKVAFPNNSNFLVQF